MTEKRFRWKVPSSDELRDQIREIDSESIEFRVKRLSFLIEEFGPPVDMLLSGGVPALMSLYDLKASYLHGNDLSVVMAAHIFVEQILGGALILAGHDREAEGGLAAIIEKATELRIIDESVSKRLDELRRMRIAYFHAHVGMKDRSHLGRLKASGHFDSDKLIEDDAEEAIRVIVDLLRFQNPGWTPENPEWQHQSIVATW